MKKKAAALLMHLRTVLCSAHYLSDRKAFSVQDFANLTVCAALQYMTTIHGYNDNAIKMITLLLLTLLELPQLSSGVQRLVDPAVRSSRLQVEDLESAQFGEFLGDHEYAVVLFVHPGGKGANARSDKALNRLKNMEDDGKLSAAPFAK